MPELPSYIEARQAIIDAVTPLAHETVTLDQALQRVLATRVVAPFDLPRFDNSAMDGYAVCSTGLEEGGCLRVTGSVAAGADCGERVEAGRAVRIMTGAEIPPGADAVVPIEDCRVEGDQLWLEQPVRAGSHIRCRGEDVATGSEVLASGQRLTPASIALLAAFGIDRVDVFRRPRVAILATGDELVPPGSTLSPAQIFDSNSPALAAAVTCCAGIPVQLGIADDSAESITSLVRQGLECDLLITAAGASVGDYDLIREVLGELGARELFWGAAIKPGKPTGFSLCRGTPVLSLPGNPVSALVTFELFAKPLLFRLSGCDNYLPQTIAIELAAPISRKPGRDLFARVSISATAEGLRAVSAGSQQTGIISSLVAADGLAILPGDRSEFAAGERVDVLVFDHARPGNRT